MIKLMTVMVAVVLLAGCGSMATRAMDMSTGNETALIEGVNEFWTDCRIGPLTINSDDAPPDLSFLRPHSLVIDAGPAHIEVRCETAGYTSSSTTKTRFEFVAEIGHTYTLARAKGCMELLDATSDGRVIACEPYFSDVYADLTTTDDTAFVRWAVDPEKGHCSPFLSDRPRNQNLLKVDAGPVSIDAKCIEYRFLGPKEKLASFDFIAETGHTYMFSDVDKKCMSLLDITSEETLIACEPYWGIDKLNT